MVLFPCPSTLLSNPELRSTPNRCTAATNYSLPFRPLPLGTPLPKSPPSHSRFHQMSGSPSNPAPIVSYSGVLSPMSPNFPHQLQQVPSQSWTSSRRRVLQPVLVMACALPMGRALVRLASLVLRVNRVQTVSSDLNVSPVHPTVTSATRESQVQASASPPLLQTCRQPATVSTAFAVPMDSVHVTPAGLLVLMVPHVRRAQRASSRPMLVTAKVGSNI